MEERTRRKKRKKSTAWPVIPILFAVALLVLALSPVCAVREVSVEGNDKVTTEAILEVTGPLEGKNIFQIGIGKMQTKIEDIPYVKQAKISRLLPDKLQITIKEADVAMYIPFSGKMAGIDEAGEVMEITSPDYAIHAPVVSGITVEECELGEIINVKEDEALRLAVQYIGYFKEYELFPKVTALDVTELSDVKFTINYKLQVEFGTDEQISYKLKYLKQVIAEVGEQSEGRINIRSVDNVTYKELPEPTEVPEEATENPEGETATEPPAEE